MQTCGERDGQTDTQTVRHDEANNHFSHSFKNIQNFEATKTNPLLTPYDGNKFIILNQYAKHSELKSSVSMVSFYIWQILYHFLCG